MTQTSLQNIFDRIQSTKRKIKDIKLAYKDALATSEEYKNLTEKIKELQGRKKQVEMSIKQDFSGEFTKLDDYKIDLESDQVMLSDAAMSKMMKGETVEVEDEFGRKYDPSFNVKFKKV